MKEMEEFSYTISHDLRSPLRAIDGFSKALVEDYEDRLDETAKDYLARVRAAAQRMGHLIDEVLELARVSSSDIHSDTVDISATAREIIEELRFNDPGKRCEITIEPDMTVTGDTALLRVALENLLSNAWKFSSAKECVRIEVGVRTTKQQAIYFVKDNGVGFDMAYANKLFKPFERLHSKAQFPGTGVGLATVKRIFQRHGGRIWADSVLDQGTVFNFTLQDNKNLRKNAGRK
jgi:light-regulated signal transduction histidine kinase (bacteriophytochrome)